MKVIKSVSSAAITAVDQSAKFIDKNLPLVGEISFHSLSYLNDTVKTSRREALIESFAESDEAFNALTKEQQKTIDAAMTAY